MPPVNILSGLLSVLLSAAGQCFILRQLTMRQLKQQQLMMGMLFMPAYYQRHCTLRRNMPEVHVSQIRWAL